jgi:hypothetical protein
MENYFTPQEKAFIQSHLKDDVLSLALECKRIPGLNTIKVLNQLSGFQEICRKVPSWSAFPDLIFPAKLPLEQCSSEHTARYKFQLIRTLKEIRTMADLTGGLGVDFSFMAADLSTAFYVEKQPELCRIAGHNMGVLGLSNATVLNKDGIHWFSEIPQTLDLVYLDPARRNSSGSKVYALADCDPDLTLYKSLLLRKARYVLVKLSPMLDITQALRQLPETSDIHVVSVDGECKELLFLLSSEVRTDEQTFHAVNLRHGAPDQSISYSNIEANASTAVYTDEPLTYLYEPNASIIKAGAFSLPCRLFGVRKLHPNSHLYTSENWLPDFPGRGFEVDTFYPVQSRFVRENLGSDMKANLAVRNFPESVDKLRKRLKIKDGGNIYLFASTLLDDRKVLLQCRKKA